MKEKLKNKNKEKGITLVALAVTVIILLILAGITVSVAFGDGGIIKKAQDAKNLWENAENATLNELGKLENEMNNMLGSSGGNGNNTTGGEITDPSNEPQITSITTIGKTSSSIQISVMAQNVTNATYTYSIKKSDEATFIPKEENTSLTTYTYTNLSQNTTYIIKVTMVSNGKTVEKEITETTNSLPTGTISQDGELTWNEKKATLKLKTTQEGATIKYKVNGEDAWHEYTMPIGNLNHGDNVEVSLWEGENVAQEEKQIEIRDRLAPNVNVSQVAINTNSISVTVTAQDNQAGMPENPTYNYYIKKVEDIDYPETPKATISSPNYTFEGLKQNTKYNIKVTTKDIANNEGIGYLNNAQTGTIEGSTEGLKTGSITASNPVWEGGQARITLSTTTGLTIQWQKNSIEGTWNEGTTVTNLSHGDTVFARLWDGTNAGKEAGVSILDGNKPQIAQIECPEEAEEGTAITATVTHTDNESGIDISKCKWVYNQNASNVGEDESSYTGTFSANRQTITLQDSGAGTYYLHVLSVDFAGKKRETISKAVVVNEYIDTKIGTQGTYIKYDVAYTDVWKSYNYTETNGWRLLNADDNGDGTYSNVELISTGIPAMLEYHYNEGNNEWFETDTSKLNTFKDLLGGSSYTFYTETNEYYGLKASAGMYYNFGTIKFRYDITFNYKYNQGYYTSIKNGSTTYNINNKSERPDASSLFKTSVASGVRLMTLPEVNEKVGRGNSDPDSITTISEIEDSEGLIRLDQLKSVPDINKTVSYDYVYWWVASPYPDVVDGNYRVCSIAYNGSVGGNEENELGVRPVVRIQGSSIKFQLSADGNYYEMQIIN